MSEEREIYDRAVRHVGEAEARVTAQREIIRKLHADGHDIADALTILRVLEGSLLTMSEFRNDLEKNLLEEMQARMPRTPDPR